MNPDKNISSFFTVLYVIFSLLTFYPLLFIEDKILELVFKILTLLSLSFLYLNTASKINFWYVLLLLFSIVSDSLYIYDGDFRLPATFLLLCNRVFYIIIIRHVFYKNPLQKLLLYSTPFVLTGGLIYYMVHDNLGDLSLAILAFYILSVILGLTTYVNFLDRNTIATRYYFFGIFLIFIGDALMAVYTFIEQSLVYTICYHTLYFAARYLICRSMIAKN